ncbi:hypothetical protein ASG78_15365 [Nostocoides sp. Soil756]|nr:hypothetical protein ASG78_15365 [Tetrasphaera sp. Soil756]
MKCALFGVVVMALVGSGIGVPVDGAVADGGASVEAFSTADAFVQAKASGARVEVTSMRSETDQVFANPDGTMTREQSLEPERVRVGGSWKAVDSTLVRAADGSWTPAVSAVPISFSPGGSVPLVSMTQRGVKLSLSWPQSLPEPTVVGNEATYSEVFPGVDLKMVANSRSAPFPSRSARARRQAWKPSTTASRNSPQTVRMMLSASLPATPDRLERRQELSERRSKVSPVSSAAKSQSGRSLITSIRW